MVTIPRVLRRDAGVQRILIVAIMVVSSLQFFFVDDPSASGQDHTTHHSFLSGPTNDRSVVPRPPGYYTNSSKGDDDNSASKNNAIKMVNKLPSPANATHADTTRKTKNLAFCGTCLYNLQNSCNERLIYMKSRHKMPEWKAKEDLMSRCGIDYSTEPFVFIHAGPHKTGTTSIQSFLYNSLWRNKTFLQEDKFAIPTHDDLPGVFGDIGPGLNLAHCMLADFVRDGGQMNTAMCNKIRFGPFPGWLEHNYNQSRNILIVAEDFDRVKIVHSRLQYYLTPYRRLRVVVGYRRMHDWLPSWYNQIVDLYTPRYIQGEARYPSFVEWIDERYYEFKEVHTMQVAARYRNSGRFESVDILNMHEEVGLLENLFCNYVPFANSTCKATRDGAKPTKPNVGRSHEYERLCTKAHLRGKLPNYHKLIAHQIANRVGSDAVKFGVFKDVNSYPKMCLNQTFLDQLLQLEVKQERTYFPKWYEFQGGDGGLRKAFEKSKHKLCSMDDELVWRSGDFDPIFAGLNA